MPRLRTLMVLGRVSNLPTVWSNCLAGWWLGGGGHLEKLPFLFAGVTFLYLGGMYLNDACDVEFDRQFRRERPVPSGAISVEAVWRFGLSWLFLGMLCLVGIGKNASVIGLALLVCILAYDAFHKFSALSPVLMGACRLLVYIVAASTAVEGATGHAVWCAVALAAYVAGLSFFARRESAGGQVHWWPLVVLGAPILLALIMNADGYRGPAVALSTVVILWTILSLLPVLRVKNGDMVRVVTGLLAGIVLVDFLAVLDLLVQVDGPRQLCLAFPGLFVAARLLQRMVPAT